MLDFCNAIREVAIDNDCSFVDINYECDFEDMNKFAQYGDGIHHSDYGRKQYAKYISEHLLAVYDNENRAEMTINCVDENGKPLFSHTLVGAKGAHVTVASPELDGYATSDSDIKTTFKDGESFTFTYSFKINGLIEQVEEMTAYGYNPVTADLLREYVNYAKTLASDPDTDPAVLIALSAEIESLINTAKGETHIVSVGAEYKTTATNRGDEYDDDGIRLTDGEKGSTDGASSRYSGWSNGVTVDIDLDLGEKKSVNSFSAYAANDGGMDVKKPAKLVVSVSEDGITYNEIASQTALKTTFNLTGQKGNWDTTVITAVTDEIISARYIRLSITPNGDHVWISEVEAALRTAPEKSLVYLTGINEKLTEGGSVIYTNATNPATNVPNDQSIISVVAAKNDGGYVVSSVTEGKGVPEISLAVNEILIALYSDGSVNAKRALSLKAGDALVIGGVDFENATIGIMPYIATESAVDNDSLENGKTLWVTHFNNVTVEGGGVIFTQEYTACAWWLHVAFKPVEGYENVYEVVEKSDGAGNGTGKPLAIPEGGFVYALNTGNDYISINKDEHNVNFASQAAKTALAAARKWKVGDTIAIAGIDFENQTVPTSTEYIDYFAPEYICTAQYAPFEAGTLGDVDGNGTINEYDYILVARAILGTYTLDEKERRLADVDKNGIINEYDYILIARHILGTYVIK
ncbi:MAG: discoidin domain-containing protein [Clostridia bacterium]|nr:discoidin domain-containing protein [Clostridia bacterium]